MEVKTKDNKERLSFSIEDESDIVLLYVPNKNKPEHYHISLKDKEEICKLRDFLSNILCDIL